MANVVGYGAALFMVVAAFRESRWQGLFCLVVPFYVVYFALARFEHPHKRVVVGVWLACIVLALGGYAYARSIAEDPSTWAFRDDGG